MTKKKFDIAFQAPPIIFIGFVIALAAIAVFVESYGPMGQGLKLELLRDGDGDIIVSVLPANHRFTEQAVEFCVPGNGGGTSPRTFKALQDLMTAMELDRIERPQQPMKG